MKINLTLDNQFRHPIRWGKCPISTGSWRGFGLTFETRRNVGYFEKQWILIFYFWKWFRLFSNQPINI